MNKLFVWIKSNKLVACLIVVVTFLLWKSYGGFYPVSRIANQEYAPSFIAPSALKLGSSGETAALEPGQSTMFLQETQLSLQVKDVRDIAQKVISYAQNAGGFLVNSSFTRPEESPYGQIAVRVPTEKLDEAMQYFRGLANKIVSENIYGRDVTKEYADIEARLATLQKTKERLEDLFNRSGRIADLLEAQREILNVQTQIDAYVGQKKYLEDSVKFTKITVYLASNELALPYAPSGTFSLGQAFKLALRSMMATVSDIVTALVWLVVYIPLIALAGLILFLGVKVYQKKRLAIVK